jgi:hypothetical protein
LNVDSYLESFVRWAESRTGEIGITVAANGILVSGEIVSEDEYVQGLASTFPGTSAEGKKYSEEATQPSNHHLTFTSKTHNSGLAI